MNPRLPVILFIRLLGLLLAVLTLPALVRFVQGLIGFVTSGNISVMTYSLVDPSGTFGELGRVLQFLLGLYLLTNGRWVIARVLRGLHGKCPKCGYDLTGLKSPRCPECGTRTTP